MFSHGPQKVVTVYFWVPTGQLKNRRQRRITGTANTTWDRQNCILVAWGFETQQRLMWTKIVAWLSSRGSPGAGVFAVVQWHQFFLPFVWWLPRLKGSKPQKGVQFFFSRVTEQLVEKEDG